jgi:hypothetical protein
MDIGHDFFGRRHVPVHKFVVSIIPVNCLFCVVAANHWCIHRVKLTTAGVRRYQVFTPIPRRNLITWSSCNPK